MICVAKFRTDTRQLVELNRRILDGDLLRLGCALMHSSPSGWAHLTTTPCWSLVPTVQYGTVMRLTMFVIPVLGAPSSGAQLSNDGSWP